MGDARSFIRNCDILPDGFVGRPRAPWRLGTVLLLRHRSAIAFIQKSARDPTYQFSDAWALPGGMARLQYNSVADPHLDALATISNSMAGRAQAEAGIRLEACSDFRLSDAFGPIVTSYIAKGATRFTLIGVHQASTSRPLALRPGDSSVQNARWHWDPLPWDRLAPANCVLVAHALWDELDQNARQPAIRPVERALALCRRWSAAMGWPELPAPWASEAERMAWRLSWNAVAC